MKLMCKNEEPMSDFKQIKKKGNKIKNKWN